MRFMLTPRLIFGAAILAGNVALVSASYAQGFLPRVPSAYAKSPPINEAQDQKVQEPTIGKDEDEVDIKRLGDTTSGDTESGDTTSSARSRITSPK